MGNKIFVGNLPFDFSNTEMKELFASYGEVTEATVIMNKMTGRSKGFGFVTFTSDEAAAKAIAEMNEKEVGGRKIQVNEAKPFDPESRPQRRFDSDDRPRRSGGFNNSRRRF